MADIKKKQSGDSFLRAAASATPATVAALYTAKKLIEEPTKITPKEQEILKSIRKASSQMKTPTVKSADIMDWMREARIPNQAGALGATRNKFLRTPIGADTARLAWGQAIDFAGPRTRNALEKITDLIKNAPAEQVFDALEDMMNKYTSNIFQPTIRRFKSNFHALEGHYAIMENLPSVVPAVYKAQPGISLGSSISNLPGFIQPYASRFEAAGLKLNRATTYKRQGFKHAMHKLNFQGPLGPMDMFIPEEVGGTFREGVSLRTQYISTGVGIFDPATNTMERMSRPEYYMKEFEETVLPAIKNGQISTKAEMKAAMRELRKHTLHKLEPMPSFPEGMRTGGWEEYKDIKQNIQVLTRAEAPKGISPTYTFQSAFRPVNDEERSAVMVQHQLYGGTSPSNIVEGILGKSDISRFRGTPQAADQSRRLEQWNRPYSLTLGAYDEAQKIKRYRESRIFETPEMRKAFGDRPLPPFMKTLYVDPAKHSSELENLNMGGLSEGMIYLRGRTRKVLEHERTFTRHVGRINKDVLEAIQNKQQGTLQPGTILGWNEAGKALRLKKGQRILGSETFQAEGRGDYFTLFMSQNEKMRQVAKFFNGGKGMGHFMPDPRMNEVEKAFSIQHGFDVIDAFISMDELKKNPDLHNQQMITELWDLMHRNMGRASPGLARRMYANPVRFARTLEKMSTSNGKYSHQSFVGKMMKMAVGKLDVNPEEFGNIFGAVPSSLGEEVAESLARGILGNMGGRETEYIKAMQKGKVMGNTQLFWGGPRVDAGVRGSVEPRLFEQLGAGTFGAAGEEFKQELLERMRMAQPEKYSSFQELMRSVGSLSGQEGTRLSGANTYRASKYTRESFQNFIQKGGGYLNLGKGIDDVYVPGPETVQALAEYKAGKKAIRGNISDIYHIMAAKGQQFEQGKIGRGRLDQTLRQSMGKLWKNAAPGGKGVGGFMRGEVGGSRYLTGVSGITGVTNPDVTTSVLPKSHARNMLNELVSTGHMTQLQSDEALADMLAGKRRLGWLFRHPAFGPYSAQPMGFTASENLTQPVISLPRTIAKIKTPGGIKEVPISPMVGMSGDLDADTYVAALVSPKLEKNIAGLLNKDSAYMSQYMQHQMRQSMFKAKKVSGQTLTKMENMIAGTTKLGVTQQHVGSLSVNLSHARNAILQNAKGAELADAQWLLERLEQDPISAKHMAPSRMGELATNISSLSQAIRGGDAGEIEHQFFNMMPQETQDLMNQRVPVLNAAELSSQGVTMPSELSTPNVSRAARTIADSMSSYTESGAMRQAELLSGRGAPLKMMEAPGLIRSVTKSASLAGGAFNQVVKSAMAAENIMGAAGAKLIKYAKPLSIGLAGSLAIATALSTPKDTLGPGSALPAPDITKSYGKAANRMNPEDMIVEPPPLGNPSAPSLIHRNSTRIAPASYNVRATATSRGGFNHMAFGSGLSNIGRGNVSLNIHDNRNTGNRHILLNKITR